MNAIVEVELDIDAVQQIHLESEHPMCHLEYKSERERYIYILRVSDLCQPGAYMVIQPL